MPVERSPVEGQGRILLRLPKSLHAELIAAATTEGVSLNQFTVAALAGAVGWRESGDRPSASPGRFGPGPRVWRSAVLRTASEVVGRPARSPASLMSAAARSD